MEECFLEYNEIVQNYYQSEMVVVPEMCNGYLAVNKGNTTIWINNFPLLPPLGAGLSGESTGLIGNRGEIYKGNNRQLQVMVGPGTQPWVVIVWKYYIKKS